MLEDEFFQKGFLGKREPPEIGILNKRESLKYARRMTR
jgi:hypothetical protein